MKILYVVESYYPAIGGVETLFQSVAEHMAHKHKVTIITSRLIGSPNYEIHNGVEIRRVWSVSGNMSRYIFTLTAIFPTILLLLKNDIVHTTTYNAAVPAWIAAFILKKPIVITVHEIIGNLWFKLPMSEFGKFLHWIYEKIILGLPFSKYIAVSDYTKNSLIRFLKKDKSKVIRIYNGINYNDWQRSNASKKRLRNELGLPIDSFLYLYYGRSGWTKGVETLIESVRDISYKIQNSKLILILYPSPKSRYYSIIKKIKSENLLDKIYLVESVPKETLLKYLQAVNVVVVPSLSEGFGYTAVESQLLGTPVVARKVGSLKEVVDEKYLYRNHKELINLLRHVPKTLEPFRKFPIEQTVRNYEKVYRNL